MLTLPDTSPVPFTTLFRSPTWLKAQILLPILFPGQRTVAAALRVMGLSDDRNYARYRYQVLTGGVWSPRQAAGIAQCACSIWKGDAVDLRHRRARAPKSNPWALPGLQPVAKTVAGPGLLGLAFSPRRPGNHRQRGRRHKKLTDWARQYDPATAPLAAAALVQVGEAASCDLQIHCCQSFVNRLNPLRSSPACAWTPPSMNRRQHVSRWK